MNRGLLPVEPFYWSQVERGDEPPPGEQTIRRIAEELGENPDALLALAGRISSDLLQIIRARPTVVAELLRAMGGLSAKRVSEISRRIRDGEWCFLSRTRKHQTQDQPNPGKRRHGDLCGTRTTGKMRAAVQAPANRQRDGFKKTARTVSPPPAMSRECWKDFQQAFSQETLVPNLQLGHALFPEAPLRRSTLPPRIAPQHRLPARHPLMRRRVTPMRWRADPPALHRVVVKICPLLLHHLIVQDALQMRALLPELIFVRFVRGPVMPKLMEQPFAAFELDLLDKLFGGEALQIAQDGVEMIVEDDPRIDGQPFVLAAHSTSLRAGPFDFAQGRPIRLRSGQAVFERAHDVVAAHRCSPVHRLPYSPPPPRR